MDSDACDCVFCDCRRSDHFGCLGHLHAETPRDQEKEIGYLSDSEREY